VNGDSKLLLESSSIISINTGHHII
jgi:hypothetical protein